MKAPTTRQFLERALTSAGEWARFADPKALAVLVILGLGLNDLIEHSRSLLLPANVPAHSCALVGVDGQTCGQVAATASFVLAAVAAVWVVVFVTAAVFPRLKLKGQGHVQKSLFYFEGVAQYESADAYSKAVGKASEEDLESELAHQVFGVASVASRKHRNASRAYVAVLVFLTFWAVARVCLAMS